MKYADKAHPPHTIKPAITIIIRYAQLPLNNVAKNAIGATPIMARHNPTIVQTIPHKTHITPRQKSHSRALSTYDEIAISTPPTALIFFIAHNGRNIHNVTASTIINAGTTTKLTTLSQNQSIPLMNAKTNKASGITVNKA